MTVVNLLQSSSDWLQAKQQLHAANTVTYTQGAYVIAASAVIGRTEFILDNGMGQIERFESRDFLIPVASMVSGATAITPKSGDRVTEVQGSKAYTYEVMNPTNAPVYRYSDAFRKTYRIHTKLVGVV